MYTGTHAAFMQGNLNPNTKLKSLVGEGWGSIIHTDGGRYVSIRTEKKKEGIHRQKSSTLK